MIVRIVFADQCFDGRVALYILDCLWPAVSYPDLIVLVFSKSTLNESGIKCWSKVSIIAMGYCQTDFQASRTGTGMSHRICE